MTSSQNFACLLRGLAKVVFGMGIISGIEQDPSRIDSNGASTSTALE